MTAAAIIALITGLSSAVPELLALYTRVSAGGTATAADVQAILSKYGVDRAVFVAAIAASEAAGK